MIGANYDLARADCLASQRLNPNDLFTRINLGLVDLKQGKYADAIKNYDLVIAADPRRAFDEPDGAIGFLLPDCQRDKPAGKAAADNGDVTTDG